MGISDSDGFTTTDGGVLLADGCGSYRCECFDPGFRVSPDYRFCQPIPGWAPPSGTTGFPGTSGIPVGFSTGGSVVVSGSTGVAGGLDGAFNVGTGVTTTNTGRAGTATGSGAVAGSTWGMNLGSSGGSMVTQVQTHQHSTGVSYQQTFAHGGSPGSPPTRVDIHGPSGPAGPVAMVEVPAGYHGPAPPPANYVQPPPSYFHDNYYYYDDYYEDEGSDLLPLLVLSEVMKNQDRAVACPNPCASDPCASSSNRGNQCVVTSRRTFEDSAVIAALLLSQQYQNNTNCPPQGYTCTCAVGWTTTNNASGLPTCTRKSPA